MAEGTHSARGRPLEPGLHLLATPIGAADDLTLRGLKALQDADALACEDTRTLRKLLDLHGVALGDRPLIAYHEHSGAAARSRVLALLQAGRSVVYASDAGTPLIADPGYKLAAAARAEGHPVRALPGPSAAIAALTLSGLPTDAFAFIGFPPPKAGARRRLFEAWARAPGSVILFESPKRLSTSLGELAEVFGPQRPAALLREITKRHEERVAGPLAELADRYEQAGPPRGEVVLVIGPPPEENVDDDAVDALLAERLAVESLKDAVRTVVERLGAPRKMVYAKALALKGIDHGADIDGESGGC